MHENNVPAINIKVSIKSNKNLRLHFLLVTFVSQMTPIIVILWRENKNLQKRGKIAKITNWFYENWLFQEETPFEENKTVMKSKYYFKK